MKKKKLKMKVRNKKNECPVTLKQYRTGLPRRYRRRVSKYHKCFGAEGLYVCKNCKRVFSTRGKRLYCSYECMKIYRHSLIKNFPINVSRKRVVLAYFNFVDVGIPRFFLKVMVTGNGRVCSSILHKASKRERVVVSVYESKKQK